MQRQEKKVGGMGNEESSRWNWLLKVAAISALALVVFFVADIVLVVVFGPSPTTVEAWFALFQKNALLGIVLSNGLTVVVVALGVPFFIALCFFIQTSKAVHSILAIGIIFRIVGSAVYLASNTILPLWHLSNQYIDATSEAYKSQLLASGQAMLAISSGTTLLTVSVLFTIAGILVCTSMLNSRALPKGVGVVGLVGFVLGSRLPSLLVPSFLYRMSLLLIAIGTIALLFWYISVAAKLFQRSAER
jgi:hypothetical protein